MKVLEKVERRLGEKLFLKGDRCVGPKCAFTRRSYPPGLHGKRRRRGSSEFGELLRAKQRVRFVYGLDDRDIKRYTKDAESKSGVFSSNFWQMLESRLDNAVFRLGFAPSRRSARQIVSHGHVTVNGKAAKIPSLRLKKGDIVALKEKSLGLSVFSDLESRLKKIEIPAWLSFDQAKKTAKVLSAPEGGEMEINFNATKIKEFYSR